MLIRIQSAKGTKRIEVSVSEFTTALYEKVFDTFSLTGYSFSLHKTRDKKNEILCNKHETIKGYKIVHGDMIYLFESAGNLYESSPSTSSRGTPDFEASVSTNSTQQMKATKVKSSVIEDNVDQILDKMDGRVERKMNAALCRHKGNSKCIHCCALDPWDESILKEYKVKHISFHTYLKKLVSGVDKGKFTYLEDVNCCIKPGCKAHPPWPQGICSKCQPSAVTLNRQTFRHVDNVTFENPQIVERFLNYWRLTGHQRIGLLYGSYQTHLDVPLGIKASVALIYEPPQEGARDHVKALNDPNKEIVEKIAKDLGLCCVGWIFTDLVPLDASSGTVKYLRHADTYFLSAHEVITAGYLQNLHPNPCKLSSNGFYGSKFSTVIVTGDRDNQVHMEGYQVSNQCQSLVRDKCLIPTKNFPSFAYVKESSSQQYVPDVYFKEKDQYGNEVARLGRPLPVEYLLLDCPVSTPNEPIYSFHRIETPFPVENRMIEEHLQSFESVVSHFSKFKSDEFLEAISDFHLLLYLATMDMLPLLDHLGPLLTAVRNKDKDAAMEWKSTEQWGTVEELIAASGTRTQNNIVAEAVNDIPAASASWTCTHCTFINQTVSDNCEMCHLPR